MNLVYYNTVTQAVLYINFYCIPSLASCNDEIQNQGEDDVDCGGPCDACPSCNDEIQNQDEDEVDCGGPCDACQTCEDGIQNQGEADIDCGGPCSACGKETTLFQ